MSTPYVLCRSSVCALLLHNHDCDLRFETVLMCLKKYVDILYVWAFFQNNHWKYLKFFSFWILKFQLLYTNDLICDLQWKNTAQIVLSEYVTNSVLYVIFVRIRISFIQHYLIAVLKKCKERQFLFVHLLHLSFHFILYSMWLCAFKMFSLPFYPCIFAVIVYSRF